MKRLFLGVVAILVFAFLVGCGGNGGDDELGEMRNRIEGRWYYSDWLVQEFNSNGTGTMYMDVSESVQTDSFSWEIQIDDDIITGATTYRLFIVWEYEDWDDDIDTILTLSQTTLITQTERGSIFEFSRTPPPIAESAP